MFPEENYIPTAIDIIRCANCGRNNEFTSLQRVVNKKVEGTIEEIGKEVMEDIQKQFRKMGFK